MLALVCESRPCRVARKAHSGRDHEVTDGILGVSPVCRVANFMINKIMARRDSRATETGAVPVGTAPVVVGAI
jgi:hypothetical protein